MNKIFAIMLVVLFSSNLFADRDKDILQNLNEDFIACGAYWNVMSLGAQRANDQKKAEQFLNVSSKYFTEAFEIAKLIGMSEQSVKSAAKLHIKDIGSDMNNDFVNVSIIIDKYGRFCKDLFENPDQRIEYWEKNIR
jgi:hypothetical protein